MIGFNRQAKAERITEGFKKTSTFVDFGFRSLKKQKVFLEI